MVIYIILNLKKNKLNLQKFKIIIKINPTYLIEIEQQNWKQITKIHQNNENIISITTKFNTIFFKW
jgi:hypothetical protein